jgi:hypothetical protein
MTDTVEDVGTNALEPTEAPAVENTETPVEVVADSPNPEPEPAPEPEKPHGNKGKTPWYMERINEETNQKRLLQQQLDQERREKAEAKALLERLQGGDKEQPRARSEEPDIDALVDARAEQKLFNQDCNVVAERGQLEIPDFNEKLATLRSIGVVNDDFLKDIFAVDKGAAHKILDRLAQEPERANLMVRMDSRRRIAELTRMNLMTETTKPAPVAAKPAVSKVPPPKPVIDALSDDLGDMNLANDKLDDQTFSKLWNKKYLKRA